MSVNLWDFRKKLFKRAYEQGLIDFPLATKIVVREFQQSLVPIRTSVEWKNSSHKLIFDKIHYYLNDFYKLYQKKKLTVAQIIDIINTKEVIELNKILGRMEKPEKHKFPPPKPERKGYTYTLVCTERDDKGKCINGYWRAKKIN